MTNYADLENFRMGIPPSVQPLWNALQLEVIGIHSYWANYRQLFGTSKERVDFLNDCAATFFYIVQDSLLTDVQLSLSKLGDPAQTMGRKNATLERLLNEITALNFPQLTAELTKHLADYRDRCGQIKKRRNRELAHADLANFLQQHGNATGLQIPGPSRQEIEDALEALRKFMNAIDMDFTGSSMAYEHFISRHDGDSLVWILKQGLRYQELREAQVIRFDDLKNFDRYDA